MIINANNFAALTQAYKAAYNEGYQALANGEQHWNRIASRITSNTGSNIYKMLGHLPGMRKWLGERFVKNIADHGYTLVNDPYEVTVEVPRDDIEDDQYGVYAPMMQSLGQSVALWPEELVFEALLQGFQSLCYDGQNFFDTDHDVASGSPSNYDSTAGSNTSLWFLMDTKKPVKPLIFQERRKPNFVSYTKPRDEHVFMKNKFLFGSDARGASGYGLWQLAYASVNDIDATNFDTYREHMESRVSAEGRKLRTTPDLLICGPSRRAEAEAFLTNKLIGGGNDNRHYQAVDLVVTPYLD